MSNRSPETAPKDSARLFYHPDGRSSSPPDAVKDKLIDAFVGPFALTCHRKAKDNNCTTKSSRKEPTSPERFLKLVKIIVRNYVQDLEDEATYNRVKAKKLLQKLAKALRELASASEVHQDVRIAFIDERMSSTKTTGSFNELLARLEDLESSFDGFAHAVDAALEKASKPGRKPQYATKDFVNELAFAWYSLAGVHPTYARGDAMRNSEFGELLRIINSHILSSEHQSHNDFDSYGVAAVKFARAKRARIEAAGLHLSESKKVPP